MSGPNLARLGIVSGALFLGLLLTAVLSSPPHPAADASAAEIASHFASHSTHIELEIYLAALSTMPATVFLLVLWRLLRTAEGETALWSHLALLAGGIALAANLATSVPHGVLAMDAKGRQADVALVLYDIGNVGLLFTLLPTAVLIVAVSLASLRTGALPRWFALLGFVAAAAQLLATAGMFARSGPLAPNAEAGIIALVLLLVWGIALWISLLRRLGWSAHRHGAFGREDVEPRGTT